MGFATFTFRKPLTVAWICGCVCVPLTAFIVPHTVTTFWFPEVLQERRCDYGIFIYFKGQFWRLRPFKKDFLIVKKVKWYSENSSLIMQPSSPRQGSFLLQWMGRGSGMRGLGGLCEHGHQHIHSRYAGLQGQVSESRAIADSQERKNRGWWSVLGVGCFLVLPISHHRHLG